MTKNARIVLEFIRDREDEFNLFTSFESVCKHLRSFDLDVPLDSDDAVAALHELTRLKKIEIDSYPGTGLYCLVEFPKHGS